MHYIRFLKPPQISGGILTAKLTITTDLGDDFLNANLPLQLIIHHSIYQDTVIGDPLRKPNVVEWKSGMRELAISIPLPKATEVPEKYARDQWQLLVWPCLTPVQIGEGPKPEPIKYSKKGKPLPPRGPKPRKYGRYDCQLKLSDILKVNRGESEEYQGVKGLVLSAESAEFNLSSADQKMPATIERQFYSDCWDENEFILTIEEETGNSIARHIWDAGVVFSSLLQELATSPTKRNPAPTYLNPLHSLLQEKRHGPDEEDEIPDREDYDPKMEYQKALNVLELGTGCGIVSATLSYLLPYARFIATDLEEAKDIAEKNLARNRTEEIDRIDPTQNKHLPDADSSYEVLDWTEELIGRVAERKWDLIVVADCTYNSDVVPDLVKTLRRLADRSPEVLIAVSLKWRHDSEAVFHDLMKKNGLVVINKHTERCGNFDVDATGKEEEVEVYLFKDGKTEEARMAEERREKEDKEEKEEGRRKRTLSDAVSEQLLKK